MAFPAMSMKNILKTLDINPSISFNQTVTVKQYTRISVNYGISVNGRELVKSQELNHVQLATNSSEKSEKQMKGMTSHQRKDRLA